MNDFTVEAIGLTRLYGGREAVSNVSFNLSKGQVLGFLGPNGAGKSTTMKMLTGNLAPSNGSVKICGIDMMENPKEAKALIGYLPEMRPLYKELTVDEYLTIAARLHRVSGAHIKKAVELAKERCGLGHMSKRLIENLSNGYQQRVGIARSLVVEPDLWFLDEPFSALDPLIRREMQDEFIRLQNILKKTIVFITHDFDEAIRLADRIAVMKDGKIEQIATPEELVQNPKTDYVADFTRHVARAKVIRAQSRMDPVTSDRFAGEVAHDATIEDIADAVERADAPLKVMKDGKVIGQITARTVIDVLVGRG